MSINAIARAIKLSIPTPFYLLDINEMRLRAEEVRTAFQHTTLDAYLAYPYKANRLSGIVTALKDYYEAADVSTIEEFECALADRFHPSNIFYGNPGPNNEDLLRCISIGAVVKVDSFDVINRLKSCISLSPPIQRPSCLIRMSIMRGGLWSRFGFTPEEFPEAFFSLRQIGMNIIGIHFHIGSNISNPMDYSSICTMYAPLLRLVLGTLQTRKGILDIGGGFASKSAGNDLVPMRCYSDAVSCSLAASGIYATDVRLLAEPGRRVIEDAGVLVTSVRSRKLTNGRALLFVDGGTNLLKSSQTWQHDVYFLASYAEHFDRIPYDIYGSLCFESDLLVSSVPGPKDLPLDSYVVFGSVGAYDLSTATTWTGRTVPIVGIDGSELVMLRDAGVLMCNRGIRRLLED